MNSRKLRILIVVFFTLVLPFLITFCLHTGKNHYKNLPFLGPKKVNKAGDTSYHKIQPFSLTDHEGKKISYKKDLKDKFFVAHFFYTDCPDHCPEIMRKLKSINEKYQDLNDFKILSFSVKPSEEDVESLKQFSEKIGAKGDKWHFLTGNKQEIRRLAKEDFLLTIDERTSPKNNNQIAHSDLFVLVDKKRRIRGFYKGTKREAFKKLKDEIVVLSVEE